LTGETRRAGGRSRTAALNTQSHQVEKVNPVNQVKQVSQANQVNQAKAVAVQLHEKASDDEDDADSFFGQDSKDSTEETTKGEADEVDDADEGDVSFVQLNRGRSSSFLTRELAPEKKVENALALLQTSGRHIGSLALSALAERARGNPFKKVKELVSKLMERLLEESEAEVSKKSYCDKSLGEVGNTERSQFEEVQDISTSIQKDQASRDALVVSIDKLTKGLAANKAAQDTATTERKESKAENMAAIALANAGLKGTNEALNTIRKYYADAAGAALLQLPVTEVSNSESNLGFKGSYKGAQDSAGAIVGLLETLVSDFEDQTRTTEASEVSQQRAFVELMQVSVADSAGKKEGKSLDEEDLTTTKIRIESSFDKLRANTKLLDEAFKLHESLKPTCVDTGMSYAQRVQKRNEEIAALEKAKRELTPDARR